MKQQIGEQQTNTVTCEASCWWLERGMVLCLQAHQNPDASSTRCLVCVKYSPRCQQYKMLGLCKVQPCVFTELVQVQDIFDIELAGIVINYL